MILEEIVNNRKRLLGKEKQSISLRELKQKTENLLDSGYKPIDFLYAYNQNLPFLIAEIKRFSPSRGIIRKDFSVEEIAQAYKISSKVNAISVLTEPDYFKGQYDYIRRTKDIANKPVLMKDFIVDAYQIYRGFIEGASAVLLIAAVLKDSEIKKLKELVLELNMKVLFEIHTETEYRRALDLEFDLIGINNRDLKTFITDIHTTFKIIDSIGKPKNRIIISESGISSRDDIHMLYEKGINGFLIGERFMKEKNIVKTIADLFGNNYD